MSNVGKAGPEPFARANSVPPPAQHGHARAAVARQESGVLDTFQAMPGIGKLAIGSWFTTLIVAASSAPGEVALTAFAASALATGLALTNIGRS